MDGYLVITLKKEIQDMSHRDNRIWLFILFICLLFSCKNEKNKEIVAQTALFHEYSKDLAGSEYKIVYKSASDSLQSWKSNLLSAYKYCRINTCLIDSLICFNKQADKCIMALCKQSTYYKNQDADGITFLYGVKVNSKWYFFSGPYIVLPRENYQKDVNTPLSFTKLHEIAMQEIFHGYLKKKDLGFWRNTFGKEEYEVNEGWFKSHLESGGWCGHCSTQAQWDSTFLHMSNEKWKYRDTTDYR